MASIALTIIGRIGYLHSYRSYFYACGVSIRGEGSENLSCFIPAKKLKMFVGGR
jgi:hypothetical protein